MRIINLTQHAATPEQVAAGVIDLPEEQQLLLKQFLTFEELPTPHQIFIAARQIKELAFFFRESLNPDFRTAVKQEKFGVMVGGALWLMPILLKRLKFVNFECFYAFSKRVSNEVVQPDGSVKKVSEFKHIGFIQEDVI